MESHKLFDIYSSLKKYFGKPPRADEDFESELIKAILSQNTTDSNSLTAYNNLMNLANGKKENILSLNLEEIRGAIRVAGLQEQKSRAIKEGLRKALSEKHTQKNAAAIISEYTKISGIGPKSIACAILFGLHERAFPVDTHISRVVSRLINKKITKSQIQRLIEVSALNQNELRNLHLYLIYLGRSICKPHSKNCSACPLKNLCEDFRSAQLSS